MLSVEGYGLIIQQRCWSLREEGGGGQVSRWGGGHVGSRLDLRGVDGRCLNGTNAFAATSSGLLNGILFTRAVSSTLRDTPKS